MDLVSSDLFRKAILANFDFVLFDGPVFIVSLYSWDSKINHNDNDYEHEK